MSEMFDRMFHIARKHPNRTSALSDEAQNVAA